MYKGTMWRSFLLKNDFWAKKGNEKYPETDKVFIKHENGVGIYATILQNGVRRGVKLAVDGHEHFFDNFDKIDAFLTSLRHKQDDFMKILRRRTLSHKLRTLNI